jgi:hypothetical protein
MLKKKLIQILLPLFDEKGENFPGSLYSGIKKELTEKFGGLTIYTRAPATGLWKENEKKITRDEIVIYEIVSDDIDERYWKNYKLFLQKEFRQDEVMIRCSEISLFT